MSCFGGDLQILCGMGAMLCPQALNKSTFVKAIGRIVTKRASWAVFNMPSMAVCFMKPRC